MSTEVESEFQLYEVVGDGWRLPMRVRVGEHYSTFHECFTMPYLRCWRDAIFKLAEPFIEGDAELPFDIETKNLGKIAEKSRATCAEDVVVWRKPEAPIRSSDDFLAAYCNWDRSMIKNPAIAGLIWDSICRFMQHWLVNRQLPVELGFAKLYAIQARANWKQLVHARYNGRMTGSKGSADTANIKEETLHKELYDVLTRSHMTAYDSKSKTVRWTLEVVPESGFGKTCKVLEETKKLEKGVQYFTKITDQLKRQIPNAYQIFRAHVLETRFPMLLLPVDYDFVSRRNYVGKEKGKLIGKVAPGGTTAPAVAGRSKHKSGYADVESETSIMSQMPDIQSRCPNMRNAGQDVEKSPDDASGATGLSLLDAVQSENQG